MIDRSVIGSFRVAPGKRLSLAKVDPGWRGDGDFKRLSKAEAKQAANEILERNVTDLAAAQELFYASDSHAALVVFQALDAAGKDGTIKHVMSGLNPQGCQVYSFKRPSEEELDHTYLWRCMKALPERGRIGIFNRSYYEEVLVVRVHPELLAYQRLPQLAGLAEGADPGKDFWRQRYAEINAFEEHLARNGVVIVKFYLHISKDEQRRRFLDRLKDPAKHWKFSEADLAERARWDDYIAAYEEAISATSTDHAPWYVIPADHKWVCRALVATVLTATFDDLHLAVPRLSPDEEASLSRARVALESESA